MCASFAVAKILSSKIAMSSGSLSRQPRLRRAPEKGADDGLLTAARARSGFSCGAAGRYFPDQVSVAAIEGWMTPRGFGRYITPS